MNIFKDGYEKAKKFYGKYIKIINTNKYNLGFKIPKYVPAAVRPVVSALDFITNYIQLGDYDLEKDYFKIDYENLVRGLDEDSIKNVDRVMRIYKKYYNLVKKKKAGILDLYALRVMFYPTKEEQAKINKNFYSKIVRTNNNLFQYEGYLLCENHFESSVFYHRHSIDEFKTLDKIRQKDIIDVGGFIGDSALVFSKYTDKKIYSFEASPENFNKMKFNLEINRINNVIPVNCALGDKQNGRVALMGSGSCIHAADAGDSQYGMISTTLDSYVCENNLEVGLIKVDIEGFEQKFLKGAENTIKTQKPALLISIYHNPDDYIHIKPIIESWNLGYKFRIVCPPENRMFETLLIAEVI